MTYEEKCNFAVKELEAAKIWKSNYNPPITRLFRKLGFKVPFPHYNSFLMNALSSGIYFGCAWGLLMYFFAWKTQNMSPSVMLSTAIFAGAFFGIAMASYYRYSFKKYRLTPWHEIKDA
ncbi:hypothetical protein GCM10010919_14260 [Alishewanella longhuensis]|uniref:DUF2628 domain-containing protein n=1 Tax=Alishewanella longhuensis TaxID=1091037 RepID=A0ABQ3L141_9ALTE|nr:DUF6404 family protein [Alishewanella longhuensis]GHG66515.1 hypothetical protein GCM10010919_14260 [Alishewanella longhuensis]